MLYLGPTPQTTPRKQALGLILFAYLKLKLYLKIKDYDADFHPFGWRKDTGVLGKQLAEQVKSEGNRKISLVAHSMGGLWHAVPWETGGIMSSAWSCRAHRTTVNACSDPNFKKKSV